MTGNERVRAALEHREGPIPLDFGSSAVTGIHVSIVEKLRSHFGLPAHPVKVVEPYQMLGEIEDDLAAALGIDTTPIFPYSTMFGFSLFETGWKEWETPWGQVVLVSKGFKTRRTDTGDVVIYPQGDTSVPPSARMAAGAYFFDSIMRQPPIDDENLDFRDNLEEFAPVSDSELTYYEWEAARSAGNPRAVFANFGGTGLGDIAVVPGPMLKNPKGVRDVEEWYISTVTRQDYVRKVFDFQTELSITNLSKVHDRVKEVPAVVYVCGTDFGTQTSSFCSTETFDDLYAPFYRKVNDWIHTNTRWNTFKHCCGACENFMEHFISAGFDVVNPVQCSAAGMDPQLLKRRYGDRLVFWGGGVDTQKTLPFGTPAEVRTEVLDRCRIFGKGGGYVFDSIHNVQANTPIENVVAMIDALHEYNTAGC